MRRRGATGAAALDIAVDLAAIRAAHARIAPHVHRTPVLTCRALDADGRRDALLQVRESSRRSARSRRAARRNAVFSLDDAEARRGVVTHSSGNHGAALAYAARAARHSGMGRDAGEFGRR